jgi:hypothetical protein
MQVSTIEIFFYPSSLGLEASYAPAETQTILEEVYRVVQRSFIIFVSSS